MTIDDKRRYERHDDTRFAWYQTIELDGAPSLEGLSHIVDIARAGIGLVAQQFIETGKLMLVKIVFEELQHHLSAVGRVKYCRGAEMGTYAVGIEFVVLPPDSRQFLETHFG
jgi:hypothetical protein